MTTPAHEPPVRPAINLDTVATLMSAVGELETKNLGRPLDEDFSIQTAMVRLGLFRLVVMGEVKKGKSSFINALCGIQDLVPVHDDIATSTIFKIRHGQELKYTVYFQTPEGGEPRKQVISKAELARYGTEKGNPDNQEKVDFIAVEAPSPFLSTGIVIVDTPGVGGLFKAHRAITFQHAPKADGVFFVTDSLESPIGKEEKVFLQDLQRITSKIYFVQTKADKVDRATAMSRMKNNLAILTDEVGFKEEDLRYFIVSSKLKQEGDAQRDLEDLKDSGFVPLARYLNVELRANLNRSIATVALQSVRKKLEPITADLAWRRKVLEADSAQKRTELERELREARQKFEHWVTKGAPVLKQTFHQELGKIVGETNSTLHLALRSGGSISASIYQRLVALPTPEKIYENARALFEETGAEASACLLEASGRLEKRLQTLLSSYEEKVRQQVGAQVWETGAAEKVRRQAGEEETLDTGSDYLVDALSAKAKDSRLFDRARTMLYGGTGALAIGTTAGAIIGSVFPVVGTAIGAWVGALIPGIFLAGAKAAHRGAIQREARAARQEMRAEVERELGSLQTLAHTRLAQISGDLGEQANTAVDGIITRGAQLLDEKKGDIEQRKTMTEGQLGEQMAAQKSVEGAVARCAAEAQFLERQLGL
ncbi:MAG TPA: dynamin family protein [Chthoniobacteraceae bacterium]|jgi:GTP-binding protein EngB required for normal cell division|nr:dynamin family protein [Chthoniobacteraceae bacterium]